MTSIDFGPIMKLEKLIQEIITFYHVITFGSFTRAADHLQISKATVSERVKKLEMSLGDKLISSRQKLILTNMGENIYRLSDQIMQDIQDGDRLLSNTQDSLTGELAIVTTKELCDYHLGHYIFTFVTQYPQIRLNVITDKSELDFNRFDVFIRPSVATRSDLIQVPWRNFKFGLFASRPYLKQFGTPQNLQDLSHHRCLLYTKNFDRPYDYADSWFEKIKKKPKMIHYVGSNRCLFTLANRGYGIASFTKDFSLLEHTNLVRVLPEFEVPIDTFLIYKKSQHQNHKLAAFVAHLLTQPKVFIN